MQDAACGWETCFDTGMRNLYLWQDTILRKVIGLVLLIQPLDEFLRGVNRPLFTRAFTGWAVSLWHKISVWGLLVNPFFELLANFCHFWLQIQRITAKNHALSFWKTVDLINLDLPSRSIFKQDWKKKNVIVNPLIGQLKTWAFFVFLESMTPAYHYKHL
jgi:hypothetical protein